MISVCIATYNGEKYIVDQLLSILPQLSDKDEIIISDDKSTDNTISIVEQLKSPIIRIIKNIGEHGYTSNFENAIRHAKGDIIFLCDQDDVWLPYKVSSCLKELQHHDMIIHNAYVIDGEGKIISDSYFKIRRSHSGALNNIIRFSHLGCCITFRKTILKRALPFPPNHAYCTHDNWIGIIGMVYYNCKVTNEKLIYYRRHNKNTSLGGLKKSTSTFFKIKYRIYLIKWIINRHTLKNRNQNIS